MIFFPNGKFSHFEQLLYGIISLKFSGTKHIRYTNSQRRHTGMLSTRRDSIEDSERLVEAFIPDKEARETLIDFLADMIVYAHSSDPGNWNLNLDKEGGFLRFNVGQEVCVHISPHDVLIVSLKDSVQKTIADQPVDMEFRGYLGKARKITRLLENVPEWPDFLTKVSSSIGCSFRHEHIIAYLPFFRKSVPEFIDVAVRKTKISSGMKNAHSVGSIKYISKVTHRDIPNPDYTLEEEDFEKPIAD